MMLRMASLSDSELLLNWANSPEVRSNSFKQNLIGCEEHHNWLINLINSKSNVIYIGNIDGNDFGQVRFEGHNGIYEIDISVASSWRGMGLGVKLLLSAIEKLQESSNVRVLKARVKVSNIASCSLFMACGFEKIDDGRLRDIIEFILRINK